MSRNHQNTHESRLSLYLGAPRTFPRGHILKAVVASVVAWAMMTLPALAQLPQPVLIGGSVVATFTVTFAAAPPAGSTVTCSLALISDDPRSPSDSKSVSAPVNGSTATCNITINYLWRLTSGIASKMTIAYSVQGPSQFSQGIVNIIPMPSNGSQLLRSIQVFQ